MLRRLIETQYFVPSLHIHQKRKIYSRMDDGDWETFEDDPFKSPDLNLPSIISLA